MIHHDETTLHQFGQLAIALYQGRVLAVCLKADRDFTVLLQCDTICSKNSTVKCRDKELHKLCARK